MRTTLSRRITLSVPAVLAAGVAHRAQAFDQRLYPIENLRRHVDILNEYDTLILRQQLSAHVAERFPSLAEEVPRLDAAVVDALHSLLMVLPREQRPLRPSERIAVRRALLDVMETRGVTPQVYLMCQRMLLSYELTHSD